MVQGTAVGFMTLQNQNTGSQICNEYINSCHYMETGGDAMCMAVVIIINKEEEALTLTLQKNSLL